MNCSAIVSLFGLLLSGTLCWAQPGPAAQGKTKPTSVTASVMVSRTDATQATAPPRGTDRVERSNKRPFVKANPNPVDLGTTGGPGKTTIEWSTGDGSPGQLYISFSGAPEVPFSGVAAEGSGDAPWIGAGGSYEFILFDVPHQSRLASIEVTTKIPPTRIAVAVTFGLILLVIAGDSHARWRGRLNSPRRWVFTFLAVVMTLVALVPILSTQPPMSCTSQTPEMRRCSPAGGKR